MSNPAYFRGNRPCKFGETCHFLRDNMSFCKFYHPIHHYQRNTSYQTGYNNQSSWENINQRTFSSASPRYTNNNHNNNNHSNRQRNRQRARQRNNSRIQQNNRPTNNIAPQSRPSAIPVHNSFPPVNTPAYATPPLVVQNPFSQFSNKPAKKKSRPESEKQEQGQEELNIEAFQCPISMEVVSPTLMYFMLITFN